MACERWWFNRGCDGTSRRRLCVLFLAFCLYVQPDRSNADNNGLDRNHYELGQSNSGSLASYGPVEFSYVSADGTPEEEQSFLRLRRAAIDKPIAPTEQTSEERSQHQSEQKLQVQQQQETTLQQQQQPPKIQNQTQQQQPKTQTQKQPQSVVDAIATPIDITDSTMYTTESSPSASSSSSAIWMGKLETTTDAAAVDKQESSTKSSTMTPQNNSSSKELGPSLPVVNNATNAMNVSAEDNKNTTKLNESTVDSTDLKNDTDTGIGDISMGKFPYVSNKTLSQHNITKMEVDTHQYYNSTFIVDEAIGKKYWVEINKHPALKTNYLLSQSHRRAATVKLKFDFPFYGHKVRNITIATGGFLYTGEYVHSWLAATQYIAPLMANFDTRLSNDSFVKYADNGTAFTVVWEKVVLHDKPKAGAFTFEVTLHQNGDIVFVYSEIPLMVEHIEDKTHPVKVGLSDAYIMDRIVFFVRRKTIYEYHRVNFNRHDIKNWTVIYLKALPTCLEMDNCRDCLTKLKDFDCKWCSELNQCSTGTFRLRQDWLLKGCDVRMIKEVDNCPLQTTTCKDHEEEYNHVHHVLHSGEAVTVSEMNAKQEKPGSSPLERSRDNMNMGVSGIIGILLVIALVVGLVAWAAYAYRNPHSASGQMLIRYRPSQWSWKRGEARYTAATIHM